ncbi:MAG: hypothetical protein QM687_07570 [Ferruginibacter sp.]
MDNRRINLTVLWLSLIISMVMLYDATYVPLVPTTEKVLQLTGSGPQDMNPNFTNYTLRTNKHVYSISRELYHQLEPGDDIIIYRSALTHTRQKLGYADNGKIYTQVLGFSRREIGLVFLGFMILLTLGILIFYKRIRYIPARTNVTIFILVVLLFFLYMHFR